MDKYEKIRKIEEELEVLYEVLNHTTIEGTKNCAIAIMILEKLLKKLEE